MKSEERHRLQANELQQVVQSTGSLLERYATTIVTVVCAALIVAAAAIWWTRQSTAGNSAAWTLLENAQTVDDFGSIAEKYKNTLAGDWARLRESEAHFRSGSDVLFSDRELANTDLKRAREGFEQLAGGQLTDSLVRERAVWGLARSLETVNDGDTTRAIEAYERLLKDFPETIYKPFAEERIASLKTGGAKEFYAWFSKQNPKPADIRPRDGADKGPFDPFLPPALKGIPEAPKGNDAAAPDSKEADSVGEKPAASEDAAKPDAAPDKTEKPEADSAKPESEESKPDAKPDQPAADSESKQP